jgi:hypothetical protein
MFEGHAGAGTFFGVILSTRSLGGMTLGIFTGVPAGAALSKGMEQVPPASMLEAK